MDKEDDHENKIKNDSHVPRWMLPEFHKVLNITKFAKFGNPNLVSIKGKNYSIPINLFVLQMKRFKLKC